MAFGTGFAVLAPSYNLGTASRMGAGFFPLILGIVLALIGVVITFKSIVGAEDTVRALNWRGLVCLLGAIVLFGALLRPLGLVLSLIVLVLLGGLANREFRWREGILLAAFLAALSSALFVYALKLPISLWPAL
ncbi:tripartite tricarboxylate transporter TctB family protein [Bradyrhizobium sp. CCGUVB1N3]|nr:tripartite tricarboxylate transporter TctB family protein [Bradyrhizobium sp. CCGUVB1N3]